MIADLAGVQPEHVFVLPFPYPPWYALVAVPLVLLPITVAARVWLELNLSMLMLSIFMLTEGWRPWKRLVAFPIAMIFLPVLGTLFVGQYTFPVLLGMALFVYAIRKEKPLLVALAAALLTFKPHLGGLMLCAGFAHLWLRRDAFGRNALRATIFTGAFLFVVGFLADPLWPLHYLYSLVEFRSIEAVSSCDLCASMPVILSNLTGSGGIRLPFWLAGGLLSTFVWLLYKQGQKVFLSPTWLVAALSLVTLLSSPYLLNYDFLLLLLPLFFLIDRAGTWWEWSLIGAVYLIPWLGLGLFGRQGNITLILSALLLAGWLYQHIAKNTA